MPFLSFESNSLSVTAVQERCLKEFFDQSQDCGNLVLDTELLTGNFTPFSSKNLTL